MRSKRCRGVGCPRHANPLVRFGDRLDLIGRSLEAALVRIWCDRKESVDHRVGCQFDCHVARSVDTNVVLIGVVASPG